MTKEVKNRLLKHLHLLQTIGYTYSKPFDFNLCNTNNFELPNSLEELKLLVQHCSLCEFSKYKTKIDFSQGNERAKILFIDETASIIDDNSNSIVLGRSGDLLINMIEKVLNIPHNEFYFTNIIKCKTALKKEPTPCEISSCKPYLNRQLELVNPKLVVVLGEKTFQSLLNEKSSIEQVRGKILNYNGFDIMPIYHPNYLLRNPSSKKEAFVDMLKIKSLMEQM